MEEIIGQKRHEDVQIITLNRPAVRNALSFALLYELNMACKELRRDSKIRALILTGAGPAFCAGADLKERIGLSLDETRAVVALIQDTCHEIAKLPMPTIAAINGDAFGGGLELALACDLRLVTSEARLGLTECSLGIIPGAGGTQRLPLIVGMPKAMELIFRAARISSAEALAIGLVNARALEGEAVEELALAWAREIALNAPLAIRAAKQAMLHSTHRWMDEGLMGELRAYEEIIETSDRLEGLKAFQEKRRPNFSGQ